MDYSEVTNSRLSKIFHRIAKPAQGIIAEQGPSSAITGQPVQGYIASQAPKKFHLYCVIEGEPTVFGVPVSADCDVSGLKMLIYELRCLDTLRDVGPHTLELWKPKDAKTILAKPANTLLQRMGASLLEFADILDPTDRLSEVFPTEPSRKHVQIIVKMTDKRRRIDVSEMPQTPVRPQVTPAKETASRLCRRELIPAMEGALQPFTQYVIDLAEGKLDKFFDPTELEPWRTHLEFKVPNGPMLILHDLGNDPDDARLTGIFKSETVHLYAVSGSGKTRLCLEGLCHQWGFYISCRGALNYLKNRAAGSMDFLTATQIMTEMSSWDERTGETENVVDPDKNTNVARRAFEMLICARLFILKRLLEKLPPGTDEKTARRRWVLVQAIPPTLRSDIFSMVLQSLRRADSKDMRDLIESMLVDMTKIMGESIFPLSQQFFAVIDEVQEAAEHMNKSFRSLNTGIDARPVLHPFYRFLQGANFIKGTVLAGSRSSVEMVKKAVSTRSAQLLDESRNPLIFHDVGLFSNPGTDQRAYLEKYLTFASTVSDDRLMQRILYWLSGRYRFTASLIELLLFTGSTSRHRVLTAFIQALTGFRVTDAIDLEEEEPLLTNGIVEHIKNYYGPVGVEDRLFGKLNGKDLNYIFDALMRWRIGSQPTTIHIKGDMHQTIASGIGHLKIIKPNRLLDMNDMYFADLYEPLVVLFLSSTFAQHPETTNLSWLSDATFTARNNSSLGFMFEEAVLMIILQMFGGEPRLLSDAFHTNQPWGERKVTLVSLKREADGKIYSCPVSWTSGSSDRLGFKATSPTQVIEFLNNPDGKCFLFPDGHMGPDLSWFFQDWETKELIFANGQGKLSETLTPANHQRAFQTVDPDFFYTVKKRKGDRMQYAPSKYPGLLEDVKSALDVKLGPEEYQPSVSDQHPKTRSVINRVGESASQPQRLTPKYLRIIATPNDHQRDRLKAEWKGDVGVLRTECVELYFPNIVWTTPSVA